MFLFLSLISYLMYHDDPPVIFAYHKGEVISGSLLNYARGKSVYVCRPSNSTIPVRISQLDKFKCDDITNNTIYVYPNSTDLQEVYNLNSTQPNIIHEELVSDINDVCTIIQNHKESLILVTDHYPEFKKVGYSNPFTPGVWNCFFFILFTLSFIIWSMIHYANIDVQTRFAKKLY